MSSAFVNISSTRSLKRRLPSFSRHSPNSVQRPPRSSPPEDTKKRRKNFQNSAPLSSPYVPLPSLHVADARERRRAFSRSQAMQYGFSVKLQMDTCCVANTIQPLSQIYACTLEEDRTMRIQMYSVLVRMSALGLQAQTNTRLHPHVYTRVDAVRCCAVSA